MLYCTNWFLRCNAEKQLAENGHAFQKIFFIFKAARAGCIRQDQGEFPNFCEEQLVSGVAGRTFAR
jgi:hypothetical protein